jgi:hypothetical protein
MLLLLPSLSVASELWASSFVDVIQSVTYAQFDVANFPPLPIPVPLISAASAA